MNKPNIILIMSDEHNASVTGCYGDTIVRTPNLNRLANEGVTFENCYTASPLCVPARLSFTAGKYVSRCGAWSNANSLPSDSYPSLPRVLADAGYDAVLGGRMSYDRDFRYGFRDINPEANSGKKHGRFFRPVLESFSDPGYSTGNRFGRLFGTLGTPTDSPGMQHDRNVTRICSGFVRNWREGDTPFFLLAGYYFPHFPFAVPKSYQELYQDKILMPDPPEGHVAGLPTNYKILRKAFEVENVQPELVNKAREIYYGMVSWLDEQIGGLLDTLADSAAADNTVVIYTSDHGDNLGEHGLWRKNTMYDTASRIPLVVWWPKRWRGRQRRDGACGLLDIGQTIAGLAGAETPDDWNGDSMVEWLDDPGAVWKNTAVSEYYAHNVSSGYSMIRQDNYKYIYFTRIDADHGPEWQLFDLSEDPCEFNDLSSDPKHQDLIRTLHARLVNEVGRDPEAVEKDVRDYLQRIH